MRKKNKLILIILLLIISFNTVTYSTEKKVQALPVAIPMMYVFTSGVAFSAFATYATWFYANGYHIPINNLISGYVNQYYDKANETYVIKNGKLNIIEKLNLATTSFLSGNRDNILTSFELQELTNSLTEYNPQRLDVSLINPDYINQAIEINKTIINDNSFYKFTAEYENKIVQIFPNQQRYPDYFAYVEFKNYGWSTNGGSIFFPTVKIIAPNGDTQLLSLKDFQNYNIKAREDISNQKISIVRANSSGSFWRTDIKDFYRKNYIDVGNPDYSITRLNDSYADGSRAFIYSAPNYYKALNGTSASTVNELENLMNTDEYLQREITKLLEKTEVNLENEIISPSISSDGLLQYDVPKTETGASEQWYNDIFGLLANVPDLIIGGTTDLINNNVVPAINTIKDTVTSIPALITNVWDTTVDVPMESINFDKLKLNGFTTKFPFSIPFDYVRIISVLNVSPIEPDLAITINTKYLKINHTINSNFINKFIVFFRWFVLLTFIIGLMMITRKVIKW